MSSFHRRFVNEVLRCHEMERQLNYIQAEINKDSMDTPDTNDVPKAPNPREIIDLEVRTLPLLQLIISEVSAISFVL